MSLTTIHTFRRGAQIEPTELPDGSGMDEGIVTVMAQVQEAGKEAQHQAIAEFFYEASADLKQQRANADCAKQMPAAFIGLMNAQGGVKYPEAEAA